MAKCAVEVIVDMNYLRVQRQWYDHVAKEIPCTLTQIEANVVVPVEYVSSLQETNFYEFKSKLYQFMDEFLKPEPKLVPDQGSLELLLPEDMEIDELDIYDISQAVDSLSLDRTVKRVYDYVGGYCAASTLLKQFIEEKLPLFATQNRDNFGQDITSRNNA